MFTALKENLTSHANTPETKDSHRVPCGNSSRKINKSSLREFSPKIGSKVSESKVFGINILYQLN